MHDPLGETVRACTNSMFKQGRKKNKKKTGFHSSSPVSLYEKRQLKLIAQVKL